MSIAVFPGSFSIYKKYPKKMRSLPQEQLLQGRERIFFDFFNSPS